jgi:hypothetical protein
MSIRPVQKVPQTKTGKAPVRPNLQLVGPGYVEPAPLVRRGRRSKSKAEAQVEALADSCPLCGSTIGRMDFEVHARSGRCGPCDEALTD